MFNTVWQDPKGASSKSLVNPGLSLENCTSNLCPHAWDFALHLRHKQSFLSASSATQVNFDRKWGGL